MLKVNSASAFPFAHFLAQKQNFKGENISVSLPNSSTLQKKDDTFEKKEPDDGHKLEDATIKYSGLAALAAIPIVALITNKMTADKMRAVVDKNTLNNQKAIEHVQENTKVIQELVKTLAQRPAETAAPVQNAAEVMENKLSIWKTIAIFAGGAATPAIWDKITGKDNTPFTKHEQDLLYGAVQENVNKINSHDENLRYLNSQKEAGLTDKYVRVEAGFSCLQNIEKKGPFSKIKYAAALKTLKDVAPSYMNGEAQKTKPPITKDDTIWSVTSEFDPIKEGGLGSVPPEIQSNFEFLGVNTPTFIPMYEPYGFSEFEVDENGKGTYGYGKKGEIKTKFNIQRIASFEMQTYRNNAGVKITKKQPVEVYVAQSKTVDGKEVKIPQLVFIRNEDYFSNYIYSSDTKTEEPEKFAFFSKAVYEFAKGKLDPKSVDKFKIENKESYDSLKAPQAMILNDWQAASMNALMRYKAPLELAAGLLKQEAADKLNNMRTVAICHNADYQGSTLSNNNDTQRAQSSENILNTLFDGFCADIVQNAYAGTPQDDNYDDISNVLVHNKNKFDRHVNLLNMSLCLADYVCPVSKNYAKELTQDDSAKYTRYLRWGFEQRAKSKTMVGVINGNDYKNVSMDAKRTFMKSRTGIDFERYGKDTPIDEIMRCRAHNKINFYNNFIRAFATGKLDEKIVKANRGGFENAGGGIVPELSDEEILNTPIFTSVGRIVTQKGISLMCETIKDIFDNWEETNPGKNKPIFYIAGEDGEGGKQREIIENMINSLNDEDKNRVVFYHGFAPSPAYMASADYFLMPSLFEPCGLTQGESLGQATPVVATAVGGLVDTIVDKGDAQYGILTSKGDVSKEGVIEATNKALDIFFNDKDKYKQMVQNAAKFDQSWLQPNKKGPCYDYLELFGIDRKDLPEL